MNIFKNYENKLIHENEEELKEINSFYNYLIESKVNIGEENLKENIDENKIEINTEETNMDICNEEEKDDAEKIGNTKRNNESSLELEDENIDIESGFDNETKYNNYDVFNEIRKKLETINLNNNNEDNDICGVKIGKKWPHF